MKVVSKIPEGFVNLHNLNEGTDKILEMIPFEDWNEQIAFCLTAPEIKFIGSCIFQIPVSNSDYFVLYKKELYINETRYIRLVEFATQILEQRKRQRTYNLGDEIEVLGTGETIYKVKIISVEAIETKPCSTNNTGSCTTYHIKHTVTPSIVENTENKQSLFFKVETKDGKTIHIGDYYDEIECSGHNCECSGHNCIVKETVNLYLIGQEFLIVRRGGPIFIDKETVSVEITASAGNIEAIILRNPYCEFLEYRVAVDTKNSIQMEME